MEIRCSKRNPLWIRYTLSKWFHRISVDLHLMVQRDTAHFLKRDCRRWGLRVVWPWAAHSSAHCLFFFICRSRFLSLSLSAAVRRVYPLCKRWRPTPLALDMATLAERFKSSVRVIKRRVDRSSHRFARSFVFYGDLRLRSFAKSENSRYEIRLWIGMDRSWSFVVVSAFWYVWNRMISYRRIRCTLQESGSWKVANVVYNVLYFTFR